MPPQAQVLDVAVRMMSTRVRSIPIVDGDRLVGIVTRGDITSPSTTDDRTIAGTIRDRLANFGLLDSHRVMVSNGVVTISGRVDESDGAAMKTIAQAVHGVSEVRLRPGHTAEAD
jgi:osmotically-inducible protein OsmY